MSKRIKVLLVEDNPADSLFVQEILPEAGYTILSAKTLDEASAALRENDVEIILLDLSLPDGIGLQTLLMMTVAAKKTPIVILTGLDDDDTALQAVKLGAQDYIRKKELNESLLVRSINYAIERVRSSEALRASAMQASDAEGKLRMALDASQTGVWYYDFAKGRMEIDEQSRLILGLSEETAFSHELLFDMVHPEDRERIEHFATLPLQDLYEVAADYKVISADGKIKNISSSGKMFFDEQGEPVRLAGTFRDVTEQKVEADREHRLALLEQREDFMATLTHDLKTPLIAANWILQAIADKQVGPVTEDQTKLLLQLRDTNRRLLSMIQNLIELYRFEKDVSSVVFEKQVRINDVVNSCIDDVRIFADLHHIDLTCSIPSGLSPITADSNAIRRVIQNLLDNAIKFTPASGRISIKVEESPHDLSIHVTDTGPGIAQEEQERLFRRFAQGKTGRTYTPGTGLGLYLCKQIVEAHQGVIECHSVQGCGATFSIRLPRKRLRAKGARKE